LAEKLLERGLLQRRLGKSVEAVKSLDEAVKHRKYLVSEYPELAKFSDNLLSSVLWFGLVQQEMGRPAEAAKILREELKRLEKVTRPPQAESLYLLACVNAQLAGTIGAGKTELTPQQFAERGKLHAEALAALRQAGAAGFADAERLRHEVLLDPLRVRADVDDVVAALEKKPQK